MNNNTKSQPSNREIIDGFINYLDFPDRKVQLYCIEQLGRYCARYHVSYPLVPEDQKKIARSLYPYLYSSDLKLRRQAFSALRNFSIRELVQPALEAVLNASDQTLAYGLDLAERLLPDYSTEFMRHLEERTDQEALKFVSLLGPALSRLGIKQLLPFLESSQSILKNIAKTNIEKLARWYAGVLRRNVDRETLNEITDISETVIQYIKPNFPGNHPILLRVLFLFGNRGIKILAGFLNKCEVDLRKSLLRLIFRLSDRNLLDILPWIIDLLDEEFALKAINFLTAVGTESTITLALKLFRTGNPVIRNEVIARLQEDHLREKAIGILKGEDK